MFYSTLFVVSLLVPIPVRMAPVPAIEPVDTVRTAIARIDSVEPGRPTWLAPAFAQGGQPRNKMGTAKRILLTALAGAGGFYAGGVIGSAIDGDCGGCDDPGLMGAVIGAPIGAASAAVVTWMLTGR